jgi:DNA polymerase-1
MTEVQPTLLLIDGHSLAFRAFYALSPENFRNQQGQHTNAVHGFISMMLSILENEKPSHLCVAFDTSRESFRTREYPEYKATRTETPEEFIGQTELLVEALAAMRIVSVSREDYEADDLIASLASRGEREGFQVLIVSGDRDTFQLISDQTTILFPIKGVMNLARMDDAAVREKYGVSARQYQDLAALVGETSDNLPGIPGVGPKTAAKWLQQFGDLSGLLQAAPEIPGKVGEALRDKAELAVRNRRLNNLVRELDFDFSLSDLKLTAANEDDVRSVFAKLNFRTLLARVIKFSGSGSGVSPENPAEIHASEQSRPASRNAGSIIPAEQPVRELATAGDLVAFIGKETFINVEMSEGRIVGFGAASLNRRLEWDGKGESKLSEILVKGGFGAWDSKKLARKLHGIQIQLGVVLEDSLLEAYLVNPTSQDYPIDSLVQVSTGVDVHRQSDSELFSESDASLDAWCYAVIHSAMSEELKKLGAKYVYRSIELPATRVLANMEIAGIAVDGKNLSNQGKQLSEEIEQLAQQAYQIIGHEVNLASPKQLQTVLFEELGMQGTRSVKTGFSTNAEALAELLEQTGHPFLETLLDHRDVSKLKQIADTLLDAIEGDGRIHTSYLQTVTSTGRLSSENPNLQNIPIKSERGQKLRSAFVPGYGFTDLLTADYSQIEMRIMAHLSQDKGLIEAFWAGEDLHNFVGSRIYGVEPAEVTSAMRSKVKAMSYGLVYGLSEFGLARQLKISKSEAKQLMSDYFQRFGGVKKYLDEVVLRAKQVGYTETVYGRRRPFADLNAKVFRIRENARRAALNAPIQGTAADIMKLAMIEINRQLSLQSLKSRLLLQVHDELVFEVAPGELEQVRSLALESMQGVAKLSVPVEVHLGAGPNWELAGH